MKNIESSKKKVHFFISQAQVLILAIITSGLMQLSNYLSIYLYYCSPFLLFWMVLDYLIFWRSQKNIQYCFNFIHIVLLIVSAPLFFAPYFAIFHPTASLTYEKVENCQIVGKSSSDINNETYSLLYVDFKLNGQNYLGQGCQSNLFQGSTMNENHPYEFLYYGDSIKCSFGNNTQNGDSQSSDENIPKEINYNRQQEYYGNDDGNGYFSGQKQGVNINAQQKPQDQLPPRMAEKQDCDTSYKFSKVKLASWLCLDNQVDISKLSLNNSCYVNFFGDKEQAKKNSIERVNPKSTYDFALITFENPTYYPKLQFICLVLFTYMPLLMSFNFFFQYTTIYILKIHQLITNQTRASSNSQITQSSKVSCDSENNNKLDEKFIKDINMNLFIIPMKSNISEKKEETNNEKQQIPKKPLNNLKMKKIVTKFDRQNQVSVNTNPVNSPQPLNQHIIQQQQNIQNKIHSFQHLDEQLNQYNQNPLFMYQETLAHIQQDNDIEQNNIFKTSNECFQGESQTIISTKITPFSQTKDSSVI